ncbi:hypothetical protein BJY04DRAFT_214830 [Aspergillus karnatakaensis]|uniref:DUF4246 domain-containing protein n=1 Tax=Aspergillus karnatakaensis TaxID=1810916 RepID=UPI003CCE29B5
MSTSVKAAVPTLPRKFQPDVDPWQLQMPGFNLPLNVPPTSEYGRNRVGFTNALDPHDLNDHYLDYVATTREITMMRIMNTISDKPEWQRKVFDEDIVAKWRDEITKSGQDVSEKMMDFVIKEMRWKAGLMEKTNYVQVFDDGVVKSDAAISKDNQAALKQAVIPLEDVPEEQRDYHPGSDGKVVDLVHPSLFPLVFGRTRVIPDRVLALDDALKNTEECEVLPVPDDSDCPPVKSTGGWGSRSLHPNAFSTKFQWLPCDVEYTKEGKCNILSYINNAHPTKHRAIYDVVEKILAQTFPLWERSLTEKEWKGERIPYKRVEYEDDSDDEPEIPEDCTMEEEDVYAERRDAWWKARKIKQPEPRDFKIPKSDDVVLREKFPEQHFQVIVKLANIQLTPESPDYEGGAWHIEGQLNERIAASAIYYYDSENITSSALAFRHRGVDMYLDDLGYEQDQHEFLQQVYGHPDEVDGHNDAHITQELGSVLCDEGRLITFPNTLQHRVLPFSLADASKPGHRKILALFLIDPHRRIISTANVPPQQEHWCSNPPTGTKRKRTADSESATMTMEEAKAYRLELMEERGLRAEQQNVAYEEGAFGLCEH